MDESAIRRVQFIEACAKYMILQKCEITNLKLTTELAAMITEKLKAANIHSDIGLFRYNRYLSERLKENLPDIGDEDINPTIYPFYNFRSIVEKRVKELKELYYSEPMDVYETVLTAQQSVEPITPPSTPPQNPEFTPFKQSDLLHGFSIQIKADAHLDETIPICARDQHLLYNIFGELWKNHQIIDAYLQVKGKTSYMAQWSTFNKHSNRF